jgi:hypothetical protein
MKRPTWASWTSLESLCSCWSQRLLGILCILLLKTVWAFCMKCLLHHHLCLMYCCSYDMIPVLLIPWLWLAGNLDDYCDDRLLKWWCSEGLVMTLTIIDDGLVSTQVITLKLPWGSKSRMLTTLVETLKNLMMTSDDILWPQVVTFIAQIESCLPCWLLLC